MSKETKKLSIKNSVLLRFQQGFLTLRNTVGSADFGYLLIKNRKLVEAELAVLSELREQSEEYTKEYQPLLEELAKKHCVRDAKNNPIIRRGMTGEALYDFTVEARELFDKEVTALEESKKYSPLAKVQNAKLEQYEEAMQKDCKLEFWMIARSALPRELTPGQIDLIFELIEDHSISK